MLREVILKTAGMFDSYDPSGTDHELWKSIAEYMDGEAALVVDYYAETGTFTFLCLQNDIKDKELAYMKEQDSTIGCYIDDRDRFNKDWDQEEYESDGLFILSKEHVIIPEPQEAYKPFKTPDQQEEIKGCSGECDLCPDADGCERCGSV